MREQLAIGIEIGGTALRLGLVNDSGKVVRSIRKESHNLRDQATAAEMLISEINEFLGDASIEDYAGIGIAMAGLVDNEKRSMVLASNLGWRDFPLGDEIENLTGKPTVADKDTNMAALGELSMGAGIGLTSFIYATLGTGVGGAVIYDGKLLRGIGNRGGEFGHVYAGGDKPCGCGLRGCLETVSGGIAISQRARKAVEEGKSPILKSLSGENPENITAEIAVQAADQNDDAAKAILFEAAQSVGIALLNAVRMIYPQAVILGGSVGAVRKYIFEPVKEYVETASVLPGTNLPPVRVLSAEFGDEGAIIGAGMSVFEEIKYVGT